MEHRSYTTRECQRQCIATITTKIIRRGPHVNELETELEAREVAFDRTLGVKKKLEILKKAEQCRFEAVVDRDLLGRRYEYHPELKLPAKIQLIKQDAAEKEEHAGGEYDVDLLKFFKLVSTNVDHTIFEGSH
jgi:hypothetical protein